MKLEVGLSVLQRPAPDFAPPALHRPWALDFMCGTLYDRNCYRTMNVLDVGNREALAIAIGTSLPSRHAVAVLEKLVAVYRAPAPIPCDNGPEATGAALAGWCGAHGVALYHRSHGQPRQNDFIEHFNGTYRTDVPDAWVFTSLDRVRQVTGEWLEMYNTERPHRLLRDVPHRTILPRPPA